MTPGHRMPVRARQLALLLAIAAGAFVIALMAGRSAQSDSTVSLPAAETADDARIRGVGAAVAIPALKAPRVPVTARLGGGGTPSRSLSTAPQQPAGGTSPSRSPAPSPPASGGDDDVIVSG